jgi:hypothetical protein
MTMRAIVPAAALTALALMTMPPVGVQAEPVNLPWCGDVDGSNECIYPTLDECERWMRPEGHLCVPNPRGGEID